MKGIYAVTVSKGSISDTTLGADIEGVFINYQWFDLQGANGKLTTLDFYGRCKKIIDAGKKLLIGIQCGETSSGYLFYNRVNKIKFTEYRQNGNGPRFQSWIPDVINPFYRVAWLDFLDEFLRWLKETDLWQWITGFKITGLNFTTVELRLPWQTPEVMPAGKQDVTDAVEIWKGFGYTEEYILSFWNEIYEMYEDHCEDKWLNLAVLGGQAFPCLGKDGIYAYTTANNFTKRMIKMECAINSTALMTQGGTPLFIKGDRVGFQLNEQVYGKNQMHNDEFEGALENGLNHGAKWLEVFDYNISGPGNYKAIIENINNDMI